MAVSFLGTLGLAMSALYLLGAVLNFIPGFAQVSRFMIGTKDGLSYGFTLLIIPYLLIMMHLYFRSKLGNWLFNQSEFELAQAFCEKRQTQNLLRSKAEALANKSILLGLMIRDGKWDDARAFFKASEPRKKNAFYWRWQGWSAELYWRLDDKDALENLFAKHASPGKLAERYDAVRAHYLFEKGEIVEAESILEAGAWNDLPSRMVIVSSIINDTDLDEKAWQIYLDQVPSATNEHALLSAKPINVGGEDLRTIRLIEEQINAT